MAAAGPARPSVRPVGKLQDELLRSFAVAFAVIVAGLALATALAFDDVEVVLVDVAGDVAAIEAGGLENRQVRTDRRDRAAQGVEILINERIGADLLAQVYATLDQLLLRLDAPAASDAT